MNKGTAIVGFFLCFLAGMGLMWGIEHKSDAGIAAESAAVSGIDHSDAPIPVTAKDPSWGNPDALVTIVEFSDFQCPFCSKVNPSLKKIKETYGPSKVRIVWKNNPLPFHKAARPAHEAAMAVFEAGGSEAFFKFHDIAFQNSKSLDPGNFAQWATQAGVDAAKFDAAFKGGKQSAKIEADIALARKVGASGTPAFRINGVTLAGALPFEKFQQIIDDELAEAKKLIQAGTARSKVYEERCKKNASAAPPKPDEPDKPKPDDDNTVWNVPIFKGDPIRGSKDALVTLVIYSDYQCPYCKRVEETVKQVVDEYKGKLRVIWKDNVLPFHKRAQPAATLAQFAYEKKGDKGYWDAHDALFESAPKLEDADLEAIAKKLGLDWAQVKKAIDEDRYAAKIKANMDLAKKLNAGGTPHFFANGVRIKGAQPFPKFKAVIDAQLAKAEAMVKKGTPAAQVYDEVMKEAEDPGAPKTVGACPECPFKGAANAKVVIHEFSDYQCPYCKKVEPTVDELMGKYGKKVKLVWRNLPLGFHKLAGPAAEAALEAHAQKGNKGFWEFHKKLFEATPQIDRPDLERIAQEMGLDMAKFKKALDDKKHKARVDADMADARKAGINGTPGFMVGGQLLSGAQPLAAFEKAVEEELKK